MAMEVLGAAASVIAVIQLAGAVSTLCYGYIGKVKRSQKESQLLVEELNSLSKVLGALKEYTDKDPQSTAVLQMLNDPGGLLPSCLSELQILKTKFGSVRKSLRGRITRSLKWPLEEKETLETISRIERQKTLFNIALNHDHIILSKAINSNVKDIGAFLRAEYAAQEVRRQNEDDIRKKDKRAKMLDWLYSQSFDARHVGISRSRQGHTGKWLLESPELQALTKGPGLLWGYGIPGAGKTYISSAVIDRFQYLAKILKYGVAYIYFNHNEEDQQTPLHVLGSLVKQLASSMPQLPGEVEELYDTIQKNKKTPTPEELYSILVATFKSFDRIFLIFDALDEYKPEQREELLPLMHKMGKDGASIFLTSREYPEDIQHSLSGVPKIKISATADDIRHYIQERVQKNPRAKRLVELANCEDRIISKLTECADGMFLLVRFHMDYLCQQPTVKNMLTALDELSKNTSATTSLDLTYDRVIKTIYKQSDTCIALALRIFTWVIKAKRTLNVKEMQIAVSIEQERYELNKFDLPEIRSILDVCGSLVMTDEASNVRLSHLTIQEYLVRKSIIPEDAELQVAIACTTYLSFNDFAESPSELVEDSYDDSESERNARFEPYPLFDYACSYLSSHLLNCDENMSVDTVLRFLKISGSISCYHAQRFRSFNFVPQMTNPLHIATVLGHRQAVQRLLDEGANVSAMAHFNHEMTALHLASLEGYEAVARLLIERGANLSMEDGAGQTALQISASNGHEAVVRLLIEKGADVTAVNRDGAMVLWQAARWGHEAVVRLLIEKGADVTAANQDGETALWQAARRGHEAVVQLLIEKGADVTVANRGGETALWWAARIGHEAVVRLLIEKGADVAVADRGGETALWWAAHWGHEEVVRLLIEKGADVTVANQDGETALWPAARRGHEAVVRLLIEKGADVTVADRGGETALWWAARMGHEAVVRLLIEKGADVTVANRGGETALWRVAHGGHEAVVRLLIEKGADITGLNQNRETVLWWAVRMGHEAVVRLLIEKGADVTAVNRGGETALWWAAYRGHEAIVRLLIEKGADATVANRNGETALWRAACWGYGAVVRLLIEKGADFTVVDQGGEKVLWWAARWGHEAVVRLLIEKGADFTVANRDGEMALWQAAREGHEAVARLLIEKGVDVTAANQDGETALWQAARWGHEAVVQLLIEKGADVTVANRNGETALWQAACWGHEAVVQLLIGKGADVTVANRGGETALWWAARWGREAIVRLLIEKGADITVVSKKGKTALSKAARWGDVTVVQLLIEKGADTAVVDEEGRTALWKAARGGHRKVVQLLLDNGADPSVSDNTGQTAVQIAAEKRKDKVVELLEAALRKQAGTRNDQIVQIAE